MIVLTLARKPLPGTLVSNVRTFRTGPLNIEDSRLDWAGDKPSQATWNAMGSSGKPGANGFAGQFSETQKNAYAQGLIPVPSGRWPTNFLLSHSPACADVCVSDCVTRQLSVSHYFKVLRP